MVARGRETPNPELYPQRIVRESIPDWEHYTRQHLRKGFPILNEIDEVLDVLVSSSDWSEVYGYEPKPHTEGSMCSLRRWAIKAMMLSEEDIYLNQLLQLPEDATRQHQYAHKNIVPVIYFCLKPYSLVMPLYMGGTLEGYIACLRTHFIWEQEKHKIVSLLLGVAEALAHLSNQSPHNILIHRAIIPSNILLEGDTPRLTDFRLAIEEFKWPCDCVGDSHR